MLKRRPMAEKQTTILNVDATESTRADYSHLLREEGFQVREAASAADLFHRLDDKPDLIILSLNLPDMDGFTVCRQLKADPATAPIPVLQIAPGHPKTNGHSQTCKAAEGYLSQPIDRIELLATVHALLRA